MSGAGLPIPQGGLGNILALERPDLAAEQQALQTRRAFAEGLLQQQPQYSGIGGALDTLGSKLLGAMTAKSSNKQALDIANQYRAALFSPSGGQGAPMMAPQAPSAPPLASLPQTTAIPPVPNSGVQTRPLPPLGTMPQGGLPTPAPQQVPMNPGGPQSAPQPQAGGPSLFDQAIPDIPGTDPRNKFALYASDPANYMKAYYASQAQPDAVKTANFAFGGDSTAAQQSLQDAARKAGTIDLRDMGSALIPDGKNPDGSPRYNTVYGPNENLNEQFKQGPNGTMVAIPIQGGAEAASDFRGKVKGAEEQNSILPEVTLPDGRKVPMYAGSAIGAAPANQQLSAPLGLRSNNPGNLQPGGQEAQFANPTAGVLAASQNLDNYAKNGINTLQGIVSTWAPQYDKSGKQINDTPAYVADVSKRLGGVDPTKPLNLSDPNVKGAVLEAIFAHENGAQPSTGTQPSSQGGQLPQLGITPGQEEVAKEQGTAAVNTQKANAATQSLLANIDHGISINGQVPSPVGISPELKADLDRRTGGLLYGGAAKGETLWNQDVGNSILSGLQTLKGLGRLDIPEVSQVIKTYGLDIDNTPAARLAGLQRLKDFVLNNQGTAQNNLAGLNKSGITTSTQTVPMRNGIPASVQQPSVPIPPQQTQIPVVNTPQEALALPPGTKFRTPDGRIKVR